MLPHLLSHLGSDNETLCDPDGLFLSVLGQVIETDLCVHQPGDESMNNGMLFLYVYLGCGVVCAAVIAIGAWLETLSQSKFVRDAMAAINKQHRGVWELFLVTRVVPVLTIILIALVWPIALIMGIQSWLERRSARQH